MVFPTFKALLANISFFFDPSIHTIIFFDAHDAVNQLANTYTGMQVNGADYQVPAGYKLMILGLTKFLGATGAVRLGYSDAAGSGTNFVTLLSGTTLDTGVLTAMMKQVPSSKYVVFNNNTGSTQTGTCNGLIGILVPN